MNDLFETLAQATKPANQNRIDYKQEAIELISKMHNCLYSDGKRDASRCALIAAVEMRDYSMTNFEVKTLNAAGIYPKTYRTKEDWIAIGREIKNMYPATKPLNHE